MDVNERAYLDELVKKVVGAIYEVANTLGPGFLEKVYERALVHELGLRGLKAEAQVPIPVRYKTIVAGDYYADIVVEGVLIIELKCCEALCDEHLAQCINYLKGTDGHIALLVNFQKAH